MLAICGLPTLSQHTNFKQLIRLVSVLNTPDVTFFIHIDKKSPAEVYETASRELRVCANVYFLERHVCHWGDFGHVLATVRGISQICERNTPLDYAILLTGQDYTIKSNSHIKQYLEQSQGKSYLDYNALPHADWPSGGFDRVNRYHFRVLRIRLSLPRLRKFPFDMKLFGGSSYWCLSKECVEYVYRFVQQHKGFVNYFSHVAVPDEIFFQTILLNSDLASTIVNDDLRHVDWTENRNSPATLTSDDLDSLIRSEKLFARKFDTSIDSTVLDRIDKRNAE